MWESLSNRFCSRNNKKTYEYLELTRYVCRPRPFEAREGTQYPECTFMNGTKRFDSERNERWWSTSPAPQYQPKPYIQHSQAPQPPPINEAQGAFNQSSYAPQQYQNPTQYQHQNPYMQVPQSIQNSQQRNEEGPTNHQSRFFTQQQPYTPQHQQNQYMQVPQTIQNSQQRNEEGPTNHQSRFILQPQQNIPQTQQYPSHADENTSSNRQDGFAYPNQPQVPPHGMISELKVYPTDNIILGGVLQILKNFNSSQLPFTVISSSNTSASHGASQAISFDGNPASFFKSEDRPNSWICFDFGNYHLVPTHYKIVSAQGAENYPKSWVIEGSIGMNNWVILDEQENCNFLNGNNRSHIFEINNNNNYVFTSGIRYIRMRQTGKNWSNNNKLCIDTFELYGTYSINN